MHAIYTQLEIPDSLSVQLSLRALSQAEIGFYHTVEQLVRYSETGQINSLHMQIRTERLKQ